MSTQIRPESFSLLVELDRFLTQKQIRAYLVGGFIRDIFIGRSTADIDVAVAADALKVAAEVAEASGGRFVLLDEANRIGRVVFFRESSSVKEPWYVDFSTLAGDIRQDLARRDFTVDAMAVDLKSLVADTARIEIIDPYQARGDLRQKTIRAVNEAVFKADPARLLRAVRLAAELGFRISQETENWVRRDHSLVVQVAGERVREELLRILNVPEAGRFVRQLDNYRVLTAIIPELELARGVEQPLEHYWDVLDHSMETVRAVDFLLRQGRWDYVSSAVLEDVPWSEKLREHFAAEAGNGSTHASLLKLAALLHDISKPETKIISKERVRFFGHTEQGAGVAAGILERLRFSNKEIKHVATMVRYHLRPTQMNHEGMPTQRAIYRYFRDTGIAGIDILFLSLADHLAARGPGLDMEQWKQHAEQTNYVLTACFRQESLVAPPKLIDGHDLINIFNMKPGPEIREILEAVREAQAAGELTTRDQALYYVKNRLLYRKQKLS